MPAANVREAAAVTDDLAKGVGTLPGNREGADTAGAHPADSAASWIVDNGIALLNLREQLLEQESRIAIAERVGRYANWERRAA